MAKSGRPTDFNKDIEKLIMFMCKKGAIDEEIAKEAGISKATLNNWKNANKEFLDSLKENKAIADEEVKRSLFERCKGYMGKETKVFCVDGVIVKETIDKWYPPDPTSMIFWLKNRRPEEWTDKREIVTSGNISIEEFLKENKKEKENGKKGK